MRSRGGEFDRERKAVDRSTQPDHVAQVGVRIEPAALDEQPNGVRLDIGHAERIESVQRLTDQTERDPTGGDHAELGTLLAQHCNEP